ncbi:molybdopterin-dependent oxidoreductase, partial [Deltaproteobacteria bacterium]|nr:molybdopterin-dependent oxidoreductase [Deltaproteobacteria bacterium]
LTSTAMLVAEEMEADWSKVRTEWAPIDPAYINPVSGEQNTTLSLSIRTLWKPLRQVGAITREMLIQAAAETWNVDRDMCRAEEGAVKHINSGKILRYGSLTDKAARLPIPRNVKLKDSRSFRLIGKPIHGLDSKIKINGSAPFCSDIHVPEMSVALVKRCPVFGGKVASFNGSRSLKIKGIQNVLEISRGIAVVADDFSSAERGREELDVKWDKGPSEKLDNAAIFEILEKLAKSRGTPICEKGNASRILAGSENRIEAVYQVPYLAHAVMEPLCCIAHVRKDSCDIWVPTQNQTQVQRVAALITGLPRSSIKIHNVFLGGSFGRTLFSDHVAEAVEISKALSRAIKVIWLREDDIQHDFYRPATYNRLYACLNAQGWPIAWFHRVAGITDFMPTLLYPDINLPYDIENIHVEYVNKRPGKVLDLARSLGYLLKGRRTYNWMPKYMRTSYPYVPTGPWRSVANSQNGFIIESFMDELAIAANKDPYLYRRHLLRNCPRGKAVLDLAASKAGWGKAIENGHFTGIAYYECSGSYLAQIAEVSVESNGIVKVHRVVCTIDCGIAVNPDTVKAQLEGGIVFGLTAALKGKITISSGQVDQSNFHDYELLRMDEMPQIDIYIIPSTEDPRGVGETGVPPIGAALVNAVYSATGKRFRELPLREV